MSFGHLIFASLLAELPMASATATAQVSESSSAFSLLNVETIEQRILSERLLYHLLSALPLTAVCS